MSRHGRGKIVTPWAQRYEEQARKLRSLAADLHSVREMLKTLEGGLSLLLADEHFRALLCVENLDRIPAILLNGREAKRVPRRPGSDSRFDHVAAGTRDLLQPTKVSVKALKELARMTPRRQMQAARIMVASGCFTVAFVNALVCATDYSMLALPRSHPRLPVDPAERKAASEEITLLANRLQELGSVTGSDLLVLLAGCTYASRLLTNRRIRKYLETHLRDVAISLEQTVERYWNSAFVQFGQS
jgi:hypothetical protein